MSYSKNLLVESEERRRKRVRTGTGEMVFSRQTNFLVRCTPVLDRIFFFAEESIIDNHIKREKEREKEKKRRNEMQYKLH